MKKEKGRNCRYLPAVFLCICCMVLLWPITAKAAVTVKENGSKELIKNLTGKYTFNYTGDTNFFGSFNYANTAYNEMTADSDFSDVVAALKQKKIAVTNSSVSNLKKTDGATGIYRAYLVWQTQVNPPEGTKDFEAQSLANANKAAGTGIYLAKAGTASYQKVTATYAAVDDREVTKGASDYTFTCMAADVTGYVQANGYGKYAVANIPYLESGTTGSAGEHSACWQLIVIEENPKVGARVLSLKVGSQFNEAWNAAGNRVSKPLEVGVSLGKNKTKKWITRHTRLNGQMLLVGSSSDIAPKSGKGDGRFGITLHDVKRGEAFYQKGKFITYSYLLKQDDIINTHYSSVRGKLCDVQITSDDKIAPGFNASEFTAEMTDSGWASLFVVGLSMEIADCEVDGLQFTRVQSAGTATVTQRLETLTDQSDTGYYDGKLVITLDDALTPSTTDLATFTVYDADKGNKKTYIYTKDTELKWNKTAHTLTLTGIDNRASGSYVEYTIPCTVAANSGKKTFENSYALTGKLRSQKQNTEIENTYAIGESSAVPMYTLTVKIDKDTLSKVEAKRGKSSASGKLGTVNNSSASVTDSAGKVWYTASYDVIYNYYVFATPTFATGYEFSKWAELTERTGESADRKASSKYVNDTTYAYERQMPNSNLTLTIAGVGETYEVRYYLNAPRAIADADSWKVGSGFTLLGNGSAESATKTYTGAQIKGACKGSAPYIYKTYRYGNYYSAPASTNIKISGYRLVKSGAPKKTGWWSAASGGTYISVDGAAAGANAGKISAADWRGYAKNGTRTDGTAGKIISLYAHWELDTYTIKFNGNGANSGSKPDMVCIYGTQYTMPRNTPPKDGFDRIGYSFTQWNTKPDGTGTAYAAGQTSFKDIGNTTLYAQWKINYYDVTLTAGNGIASVSGGGRYAYNSEVSIDAVVRSGYHWKNWVGTYTFTNKAHSFALPAQNVNLTAEAEANTYTICFDPNTGKEVTPIPDIVTAYDQKVTLPDANGAYIRYTLDGADITQEVLDGTIVLDENGFALTAEEAAALEAAAEAEGETAERETDAERLAGAELLPDAEDLVGAEQPEEIGEMEKAADAEGETIERALDAESLKDAEASEEIAPQKKAYASVFMGWALEDGKDDFQPRWKYGEEIDVAAIVDAAGLADTDGAQVTLYAVWDDCPWITVYDLYFTLGEAQRGELTEEKLLSYASAIDREDGSPIAPGTNPALNNPEVFTSFSIPDYRPEAYTELTEDGAVNETFTVVDSAGSVYNKTITVSVVDTAPRDVPPIGTTRFIDEYYYNQPYEYGGLAEDSIWKTDPEYVAAIKKAFENLRNDTPEETYYFSHETILEMKAFVQEHGHGNIREPHALTDFYNQFMAPNRVD